MKINKEFLQKLETNKEEMDFRMKGNIWRFDGQVNEDFPQLLKENFNIDCTSSDALDKILTYGKKKQSSITYNEMWEIAKKFYEDNEDKYEYIGIRFENKQRKIGDICNNSRANLDRDDVRDYPEYDSDEYNALPELDGTCAYDLSQDGVYDLKSTRGDSPASSQVTVDHCYIVVGDSITTDYAEDDNEIIIKDAKVVKQLF